jgi:hypothetical protein
MALALDRRDVRETARLQAFGVTLHEGPNAIRASLGVFRRPRLRIHDVAGIAPEVIVIVRLCVDEFCEQFAGVARVHAEDLIRATMDSLASAILGSWLGAPQALAVPSFSATIHPARQHTVPHGGVKSTWSLIFSPVSTHASW